MQDTPKRATYLYLLLTLLFSSVIWSLIIWSGHIGMAYGMMITAIMWCPALATLVSCRLLGRDFRSLAWSWPQSRYVAAAYFLPLAYAALRSVSAYPECRRGPRSLCGCCSQPRPG